MTRRIGNSRHAATGKTILCIDDQAEFLEAIDAVLRREGHRVFTARTGPEGLDILEREKVDLLLLDYCMPEMSAEDVLTGIRDPLLQIVLLTGYATERPPRELLEQLNIQGYCDKSRGPEEILLWADVALRHGETVGKLNATESGLHRLLSTSMVSDEPVSFEAELEVLMAQTVEAAELSRILVALTPARPIYLPPSHHEEEPGNPDDDDALHVAGSRGGPWIAGELLSSQLGSELAGALQNASRIETTRLPGGTTVVPLHADGRWIGCLWVDPSPAEGVIELDILSFFAAQIANRCLAHQGTTIDALTGLQSFPFWKQIVCRELRQAFRFGHPASLVRVTSPKLNELRLHSPRQANAIIPLVGRLLHQSVRGTDLVGRGDRHDILVLLSHTGAEGAFQFAKNLSQRLEKLVIPVPEGCGSPEGCLGVATLEPHPFQMRHLPKPMPFDYYAVAQRLLQARAEEVSPLPDGGESFPVHVNPRTDWPDPRQVLLDRTNDPMI